MPPTTDPYSSYRNTLTTRYASPQMSALFSERHRAQLWRQLWIDLAESEKELGLPISADQIQSLKKSKMDIQFDRIREWEVELKHDVMSHLKAYGEVAVAAEPILHLGATSAFITDNADALILREAALLIREKLVAVLKILSDLMIRFKDLEMTGFTHFQPAQPVTLGKRFGLWAQDLVWDLEELEVAIARLQPLGCKGTTGTQASFAILFDGAEKKVFALDDLVCKKMGFSRPVYLSGQTLSRKADVWFMQSLANIASSLSKLSYDFRLLQHLGEVREPFGKSQIGSSAMAYKQNPMLAERITGLARFLMTISQNAVFTHATQWLERSLDDSSNRRLVLPEAFLTADAILETAHRILQGVKVDEEAIAARLEKYSPLFETEGEMMRGTLKGGSRQSLHEEIRKKMIKGKITATKNSGSKKKIKLSGISAAQVQKFHDEVMKPVLKKYQSKKSSTAFEGADL